MTGRSRSGYGSGGRAEGRALHGVEHMLDEQEEGQQPGEQTRGCPGLRDPPWKGCGEELLI